MTTVSLRPATEDDTALLTEVVIAATRDQGRVPADFDEASFRVRYEAWTREQLTTGDTSVIEVDGEAAGRLRVVRTPERIELAGIQLLPRFQSAGHGRRILDDLQQEARDRGVPLDLGVGHDNPRARAFYERAGFVLVGTNETEHLMRWEAPAQ